jgi:signal transduction histidine kinase/DNA-binding response OmpR family regulator
MRPTLRPPPNGGRTLTTTTVLICCGLAALMMVLVSVWMVEDARNDATRAADQQAANLAALVQQDAARNIELFDLSLQAVIGGLQLPGLTSLSPELRHRVLFDRSASARYLTFINALDETGDVIADSQPELPTNWSSRDYFIAQKRDASDQLFISRPFATASDENAGIAFSRRISHPDGTFAGVVVGGMRLAYFRDLFKQLDLGPHGSIALLRTDGTYLMRLPFDRNDIGRMVDANSPFHDYLRAAATPVFAEDPIDHVARRFTTRRIGDLPLVVMVGLATDDIYAAWQQRAAFIAFACVLALLAGLELALRLMREIGLRKAADQAGRKKSDFLATLSHELRTPLHGILGYAERLRIQPIFDEAARHQIGAIAEAGRHMRDVINGVLAHARVEANMPEPHLGHVDLHQLLDQSRAFVEPGAAARGLRLDCTLATGAPQQFVTDEAMLRQILLNLLGNAVKFTEAGSIELRLSGSDQRITCEIADTGIGVPPELRHRLFQDYERLGADERGFEGSGLGLSMARTLVHGLGGEIGHRDNAGGGSVFWFSLPAGRLTEAEPPAPANDSAPGPLNILVADDSPISRDSTAVTLRASGHHVTEARDGSEVVELAESQDFDVILMDLRMPVLDGIEATRRIRALGGSRSQIPIVAMTANALEEPVRQSREAGMDGYLTKPVTEIELMAALAKAVRCRGPLQVIDHEILASLAAHMNPQDLDGHLHALAARIEAMLRCLTAPDAFASADALGETAHELAGSAGVLGFTTLAEMARRLETALVVEPARAKTAMDAFRHAALAALAELHHREPA